MRNTPLPFMSPFNQIDPTRINQDPNQSREKEEEKKMKISSPDIDNAVDAERERLSKNFESARTKKEKRKEGFTQDKEKIKSEISYTQRGLINVRTSDLDKDGKKEAAFRDRKKALRMKLQKARLDERKKRAEDRKQQWAEKQFMKGKYDSVDAAKSRFQSVQDMTVKDKENRENLFKTNKFYDGGGEEDSNNPNVIASENTEASLTNNVQDNNLTKERKIIGTMYKGEY